MKATGIIRRIDILGRYTLPMELRKTLDIKPNDQVEMFTEDDKIILKKYTVNTADRQIENLSKSLLSGDIEVTEDDCLLLLELIKKLKNKMEVQ